MDLIRDVLDNQIVDREGRNMGRVDGIVGELRPGQPVRVACIELGPPTLAGRLHPRLGEWVEKRMPSLCIRVSFPSLAGRCPISIQALSKMSKMLPMSSMPINCRKPHGVTAATLTSVVRITPP